MAIVFNIQRFSLQDGPGIRTTVFVKGCPLSCQWCSNPESQAAEPEVAHRSSLCQKCGTCATVCEQGAITMLETGPKIDHSLCIACGTCVEACKVGALKIYGSEMTADEVFKQVSRDKPFYDSSGGGVTVSGGEPLTQPTFVADLFRLCRSAGIHTCVETSGCVPAAAIDEVVPWTDLVLFDLKLVDPSAHQQYTGVSNTNIVRNLKSVAQMPVQVIVRIPLIPGINDTIENLEASASFIEGIDGLREVELLQYHQYGESKYEMLDRPYELSGLEPQDSAKLDQAVSVFLAHGLKCKVVL
jgi:pyruvate formate lyase activating enzyme